MWRGTLLATARFFFDAPSRRVAFEGRSVGRIFTDESETKVAGLGSKPSTRCSACSTTGWSTTTPCNPSRPEHGRQDTASGLHRRPAAQITDVTKIQRRAADKTTQTSFNADRKLRRLKLLRNAALSGQYRCCTHGMFQIKPR